MTFGKVKRLTREGAQMAKIQYGVKPDNGGPKMAKILGGGKISVVGHHLI